MPVSDAQKRANERYRRASVKQLATRFYPTGDEYELYEFARGHDNVAGWLKQLIREAMERERGGA